MLQRLHIHGFKSLVDVETSLPSVAVLFGPNASGKSNLLDAIQALSRLGTSRTVSDALSEPIRGYQAEAFSFPAGGLAGLLTQTSADFRMEATLRTGKDAFRYAIGVELAPSSGSLSVNDEYLAALSAKGTPKGNPSIELVDGQLRIRRKSKPAHPRTEPIGLNHTILSDPRLGGVEYRAIEKCRNELSGWRTYYLDPRVSMRRPASPADVNDIGVHGKDIAPFLYRLRAEEPQAFASLVRTFRTLIPSVEDVSVDLDKRRGTIDIVVRQSGTDYSSRIVSEGSLRVLALCAIAVNPWGRSLVAFEEPENGVHPRRLELIAELLLSVGVDQGRQVIVTTHSPLFCEALLSHAERSPQEAGLFVVRRGATGTEVEGFESTGLFRDPDLRAALATSTEDGAFERLMLRGFVDE